MSPLEKVEFDYKLQRLSNLRTEAFECYFQELPRDPYIKGNFRLRRFSRFQGLPVDLTRLEHKYFEQSAAVNKLAGGVKRDFAEIEEALVHLPEFQKLIAGFVDFAKIDPVTTEMGVHQIRIRAVPGEFGEPAPEGIHQDGFDFVGIFCIKRFNLIGAETQLYEDPKGAPIFAKELQPGEFVLVNDRRLFHYTNGIQPADSGAGSGIRDVFVITA
jgi:hypothetical protein